jgi:hypothetical protein
VRRALAWTGLLVLVVLGGRSLAYALSPAPLASELSQRAGGPTVPVVAAVSLGLALLLAAVVTSLAALAVRERRVLESQPVEFESRLALAPLLIRALALWLVAMPVFALVESYIHWRAGLGWHGLHCLVGPAHHDAIPLLGALSLVAAAVAAAVEHVLAWMRRTFADLAPRIVLRFRVAAGASPAFSAIPAYAAAPLARGPPLRS